MELARAGQEINQRYVDALRQLGDAELQAILITVDYLLERNEQPERHWVDLINDIICVKSDMEVRLERRGRRLRRAERDAHAGEYAPEDLEDGGSNSPVV